MLNADPAKPPARRARLLGTEDDMSHAAPADPPVTGRRRGAPPKRWLLIGAALVVVGIVVAAAVWFLPRFVPWWNDLNRPPQLSRVAAGRSHTCAVTTEGGVKCWGENSSGQLGNGTTTASTSPVSVQGLSGVVAVSGSGNHTCALTGSGAVFCWGANESGQLGNGGPANSPVPVGVTEPGSNVRAVNASVTHTCALTASRALWCWGDNGSGELGPGRTPTDHRPAQVTGLPGQPTDVAAGNGFTCAVLTGRYAVCLGDNGDGQLGLGDATPRATWEYVVGLPRISFVSAGDAHACTITHDAVIMCWGANFAGQLGVTKAARNAFTPMGVPGIGDTFTALSAGYRQTCAVSKNGVVTCWGGSTEAATEAGPAVVAGLPAAQSVSVGAFHACAMAGTEVWCWGQNTDGQLGDGTVLDRDLPTKVTGF